MKFWKLYSYRILHDNMSDDSVTVVNINEKYVGKEFFDQFQTIRQSEKDDCSIPFAHFVLNNFLQPSTFIDKLRDELTTIEWARKSNDLYSLDQTVDLANVNKSQFPSLHYFRTFMQSSVRNWLSNVSNEQLSENVSITGSRYNYTDVLLPHDDRLERRKFAFVLYLVDEQWNERCGGQLQLYASDKDTNRPTHLIKSLLPKSNTFVLFEVSSRSWHSVAEVLIDGKQRLSLNGWFHVNSSTIITDEKINLSTFNVDEIQSDVDISYDEVLASINPEYLDIDQQNRIAKSFESESEIILINFLKTEMYEKIQKELQTIEFVQMGPPDKRNCGILDESKITPNSSVDICLRLFRSDAMRLLLSQWTGLPLHIIDDDNDASPSEKRMRRNSSSTLQSNSSNIKCSCQLIRYCHGDYSLVDDQTALESAANGYSLDVQLFVTSNGRTYFNVLYHLHSEVDWPDDCGGVTSYIAKDDEHEILSIKPRGNSLAIVYREPDVFSFVKYINARVGKNRCFYSISCAFSGHHCDDDDDESSS